MIVIRVVFSTVSNTYDEAFVQKQLVAKRTFRKKLLNPFVPNAPFLYPLKTSENLREDRKRMHPEQMG